MSALKKSVIISAVLVSFVSHGSQKTEEILTKAAHTYGYHCGRVSIGKTKEMVDMVPLSDALLECTISEKTVQKLHSNPLETARLYRYFTEQQELLSKENKEDLLLIASCIFILGIILRKGILENEVVVQVVAPLMVFSLTLPILALAEIKRAHNTYKNLSKDQQYEALRAVAKALENQINQTTLYECAMGDLRGLARCLALHVKRFMLPYYLPE